MEGDKVSISTVIEEKANNLNCYAEISPKPQYMLKEEYNQHLIECAIGTLKATCDAIYPDNAEMHEVLAMSIAKRCK